MKRVFLLIYAILAPFSSVTGICLTWNATTNHVFIKCHVFGHFSIEQEILLIDSSDRNRAKCFIYDSPKCTAREHDDIILEKSYENSFTLVLQTAKKNVEGDWKCFHGSDKANVNIHLMKGTVYSADIHLSGEIMEKTTKNKFKLTCYSCWVPDTESVNFFVNGGLEDSVRYKDGKCYQKRKLCSPSECTCSNEGNKFTWSFLSDLSFLEFSCEMRFNDEETSTFSIQTANLSYNESVFQQKLATNKTYAVSDKGIPIDGGNVDVLFLVLVASTTTVAVFLLFFGITFGSILFMKNKGQGGLRLIPRTIPGNMSVKQDSELHMRGLADVSAIELQLIGTDRIKKNVCRIETEKNVGVDQEENSSFCGDQQQLNNEQGHPTESVMSRKRKKDASFSQTLCDMCAEIPVCTMCINCREIYCKSCCDVHTELEKDHHIIHIPHVAGNQEEIICGKCVKNKAEQLCTTCLNLMCDSCAESQIHTGCKGTKMMIIYQGHPKLQRQKSEEKLNYFQDLSIKKREEPYPIRICGMSYIADGRLVLVDKNNRNLLVFKSNEEKIKTYLEEEPHALTLMTGQRIAITFPFQMEIRIYEISKTYIVKLNHIYLPSLGEYILKPFSIAFDKDVFVVEVGEGDDGKIIITNDKQVYKVIQNRNFAYFTGNTIRLALEVKTHNPLEGRIFLSALSKNVVLCFDFQGKQIWKVSIPSPRGISVVPVDYTPGNNLVICSRRCNAIFGLNKDNGRDKQILLSEGKIKLPRFISYNSKDRLICIQVAKGDEEDESVSFVEVRAPPSIKPTKTIDV